MLSFELFAKVKGLREGGKFAEALQTIPDEWESAADLELRALFALESGTCHFYLKRYHEACQHIQLAYDLHEHVTTDEGKVRIINAQAWRLKEYGEYDEVVALLQSAYQTFWASGRMGQCIPLGYLFWTYGWCELQRGNHEEGMALLQQAESVLREINSPEVWCILLDQVEAYADHGQVQSAWQILETIPLAALLNAGLKSDWHRLHATIRMKDGRSEEAAAFAEQALALAQKSRDPYKIRLSSLLWAEIEKTRDGRVSQQHSLKVMELSESSHDGELMATAMGWFLGR